MNREWYHILIWPIVILLFVGIFVFAYIKDHPNAPGDDNSGSTNIEHTVSSGTSSTTVPSHTEPSATTGITAPEPSADQTQPEDTTAPTETPNDTQPVEDTQAQLAEEYKAYMALTPEEQQAYFLSYESYADFMEWFEAAKTAYEESLDRIEIEGDGNFDIGDYIEGNN